jgi:hypothetical protein
MAGDLLTEDARQLVNPCEAEAGAAVPVETVVKAEPVGVVVTGAELFLETSTAVATGADQM